MTIMTIKKENNDRYYKLVLEKNQSKFIVKIVIDPIYNHCVFYNTFTDEKSARLCFVSLEYDFVNDPGFNYNFYRG